MYRAVALAGMRRGVDWAVPEELARLAETIDLEMAGDRVLLDGEDVTERVRSSAVTAVTRYAADNPRVRARLVELQRAFARGKHIVTEGRDQGTVAFPDAECKIFITASPEERARRRWHDLQLQGEPVTLEQVMSTQQRRDREDAARRIAPLAPAADAVLVSTDGMTLDEVVDRLEALARENKATGRGCA